MPYLNKQILMGNLGRDPEARTMPSGAAVCNFSLATTEQWKDKQTGEWQEHTTWHRVAAFGQLAERCARGLLKGDLVYLEGRTTKRKYTQDGVEREITEVKADVVKMFKKREQQAPAPAQATTIPISQADFDDDIPF